MAAHLVTGTPRPQADHLRLAGYHTALVGKWHLGLASPNTPNQRGFDFFQGFPGDMMDSYTAHLRHGQNYRRRNREVITAEGHATDLFFAVGRRLPAGAGAGLLRDGKGSTWEGGLRVPAIAWMPGRIQSGVTSEPVSTLDWFPTVLALVGVKAPREVALDGADIAPLLVERKGLPQRPLFHLGRDPAEQFDVADGHPGVLAEFRAAVE